MAYEKSVVLAESSRLISQIGNGIVLNLYARIREIEALTRTVALAVETLPRSEAAIRQTVPSLLDFHGDLSVAGGGVWPEPYQFTPTCERRSFFWGRDRQGVLQYFDDYNQSGSGYHRESWYVVGNHLKPGQCCWSASYTDPYSCQPMVTCTTPTFAQGQFSGVVTIDLKLEELQALIESWRQKTGGYVFVVDRDNRFLAFPQPNRVMGAEFGQPARPAYILANELAQQEPLFKPLGTALEEMNRSILAQVQDRPDYQSHIEQLSHDSGPMSSTVAGLLATVLADPLGGSDRTTYLYQEVELTCDLLLQEAASAFLFHVPHTYWKVVVVKPFSEAALATYRMIQAEKMSSLGQLVAGVAHEINNPINFIYGNLGYANTYIQDLLQLVQLYQQHYPEPSETIQAHLEASELDFIVTDLPKILASMKVGADRIRQLVLSLRNFARMDEAAVKLVDIHEGIDSTLLLLESRLRPRPNSPGIHILREYGELPRVECFPAPLNQVVMNLLINAIDALEEHAKESGNAPDLALKIWVKTQRVGDDRVAISIADNGPGIAEAIQQRLFDPFFTTKPVGKGTGLGLAICYQIVTEQHGGQICCCSTPGQGAEFQIEIPIRQPGVRG